MTTFEMTWCKG